MVDAIAKAKTAVVAAVPNAVALVSTDASPNATMAVYGINRI